MNLRQAKSTLLIFTYIFVMFLLPMISVYALSIFLTNDADIQVYANLISYIVLVAVSFLFFGRELKEQFKSISSPATYLKGILAGWGDLICCIIRLWNDSYFINSINGYISQSTTHH